MGCCRSIHIGKRRAQLTKCSNAWAFEDGKLDAEGQSQGPPGVAETSRRCSTDSMDERGTSIKRNGRGANHVPLKKLRLKALVRQARAHGLFAQLMSAMWRRRDFGMHRPHAILALHMRAVHVCWSGVLGRFANLTNTTLGRGGTGKVAYCGPRRPGHQADCHQHRDGTLQPHTLIITSFRRTQDSTAPFAQAPADSFDEELSSASPHLVPGR